jgi:hypothetical protein
LPIDAATTARHTRGDEAMERDCVTASIGDLLSFYVVFDACGRGRAARCRRL